MSKAKPNGATAFIDRKYFFLILRLLLGGWLTLLLPLNPVKAQQFDSPPPPPGNYEEFVAPPQTQYPGSQYNRECYRVLVSEGYGLDNVRRVERGAFRPVNPRGTIQAGVFCDKESLDRRIEELRAYGIDNIGYASVSTGQVIGYPYSGGPSRPGRPSRPGISDLPSRCYDDYEEKLYYVVVPALDNDVSDLLNRIRATLGFRRPRGFICTSNERGLHVRVGPFNQRSEAEYVNRELRDNRQRDNRFRNSRVYYGK